MIEIERIRESSQYLATLLRRCSEYVTWLIQERNLYKRYPLAGLYEELNRHIHGVHSFDELILTFRQFKQRHFLRIGGRDLLGWADLSETTSQLSDLACVSLQVGLDTLSSHPEWWAAEQDAHCWPEIREGVDFVIIGLGKLGGNELNYVSDIDILFLHEPKTEGRSFVDGTLPLLSSLCLRLIRLLSDRVEGDRVFEVDLRLRPQGKDGILVPSKSAAADHYLQAGRPWERQMLLKARPVAGARSLGMSFMHEVRPFVFRRFLDFQALDELRAMRDRILAQAGRPRAGRNQFDVKLGVGGIREIEFFVQSLQLIYGGRHPELAEPNTLRCLDRLLELQLLAAPVTEQLKDAYEFLRRVEHWIQLDQNRQTQALPQSEEARRRLSLALGLNGDYELFVTKLEECCARVHDHFAKLFRSNDDTACHEQGPECTAEQNGREVDFLQLFPSEPVLRMKDHLTLFASWLPPLVWDVLEQYSQVEDPAILEKVSLRLERYFSQVRKRPGLVKAFDGSASWLKDFCTGLMQSELMSALLSHNPSLVEGIISASGKCPDTESWEDKCSAFLAKHEDYEEGLEWIRRLKNERLLQLIMADLRGDVEGERLEGMLSSLAEFVVRNTYDRTKKKLLMDNGLPLSVLALGKLGSREMSYLSDLDLVFVYEPQTGESEDQIPPDIVRLAQRFMRMLSTPLHEGPGYAVDTRLRPSGNYGPLIVTRKTWFEYYQQEADIWEIQALLRVRRVAGDPDLGRWVEDKARGICYQKRSSSGVWQRICHLRERMQRERSEENLDTIDIKLGMGGLADLEFLVQGLQLTQGHSNPDMQHGSVRLALRCISEHMPSIKAHGEEVRMAYESLRALEHRLRLHTNFVASRLNTEQWESLKAIGLWSAGRGSNALEDWGDLLRLRRRIRSWLLPFCSNLC